jgi:hypothetical protein
LEYTLVGDYYLPNLAPPVSPMMGRYGRRYLRHLKEDHRARYTALLLSGKLNAHLEEIDRAANEMFDLLINQYAEREGVTEELKAEDQMKWVQRMNGIRGRVEAYIRNKLICNC